MQLEDRAPRRAAPGTVIRATGGSVLAPPRPMSAETRAAGLLLVDRARLVAARLLYGGGTALSAHAGRGPPRDEGGRSTSAGRSAAAGGRRLVARRRLRPRAPSDRRPPAGRRLLPAGAPLARRRSWAWWRTTTAPDTSPRSAGWGSSCVSSTRTCTSADHCRTRSRTRTRPLGTVENPWTSTIGSPTCAAATAPVAPTPGPMAAAPRPSVPLCAGPSSASTTCRTRFASALPTESWPFDAPEQLESAGSDCA